MATDTENRNTGTDPMRPFAEAQRQIKALLDSGRLNATSEGLDNVCRLCYGTGFHVTDRGARRCECRGPAIIARRLERIPPRYEGVTLESLSARVDLHPNQREAVELIKANPRDSYVFCGKPDTGKTHLFYALYEHATRDLDRAIVACSMLQLINQYREAFKPVPDGEARPEVAVRPNDLMCKRPPYSLFLDDIDKPKITEYVAEQIHALFDAAYLNKHQIVVTTNLSPDKLEEHFERADERYGRAIVRRIIHVDNNLVEFF